MSPKWASLDAEIFVIKGPAPFISGTVPAQTQTPYALTLAKMLAGLAAQHHQQTTVRNILKRQHRHPTKPATHEGGQSWETFLENHRTTMASMDFKVTFDWRGKLLYIFNIIDHDRRELVVSRATPNPSSDWVAQQIRDAYPFDEAPKRMMMDHDSIFLPLVHTTLPNMGIKVVRTSVGCPWQNGVVERSPIRQETAANEATFMPGTLRAQAIPWLGGLHHSYCRAA